MLPTVLCLLLIASRFHHRGTFISESFDWREEQMRCTQAPVRLGRVITESHYHRFGNASTNDNYDIKPQCLAK